MNDLVSAGVPTTASPMGPTLLLKRTQYRPQRERGLKPATT